MIILDWFNIVFKTASRNVRLSNLWWREGECSVITKFRLLDCSIFYLSGSGRFLQRVSRRLRHGWTVVARAVRPPAVRLREDEHQTGRCGVRVELRQETELQKADRHRAPGPGSRSRRVRPGRHRFGFRSQVPSADVHVFLQPYGIRKLHGLLSGQCRWHNNVFTVGGEGKRAVVSALLK